MNRSFSRIFIGLVTVLTVAVTGAALSWACSPGGEISGSQTGANSGGPASGPSGSDVQVTGRGFTPGRSVEIHWNELASPILDQVNVAQDGTFEASITIPRAPVDTHTIIASTTNSEGTAFTARMPFTVTAGTANNGPSGNEAPASQGGTPQTPAQSTPGAVAGQTNGGSQSTGTNSQSVNAPTAAPTGGRTGDTLRPGGSLRDTPLGSSRGTESTRGTVPGPQGEPVFAGSVASPAGSVSGAGSSAPSTAGSTAQQSGGSEQSASDDLWGGYSSASASPPSLNGAPGPADDSSQPMMVGLGLLGFGLVALVSGFGVADFRRRRRVATQARSR